MLLDLFLCMTIIASKPIIDIPIVETVMEVQDDESPISDEEVTLQSESATLDDVLNAIEYQTDVLNTLLDVRYESVLSSVSYQSFVGNRYGSNGNYTSGGGIWFINIPYDGTLYINVDFNGYNTNYVYGWFVTSDFQIGDNIGRTRDFVINISSSKPYTLSVSKGNTLLLAFNSNVSLNSFEMSYEKMVSYSFTDIGNRLTSMDDNYSKVNERNLTEAEPEEQELIVNKYEDTVISLLALNSGLMVVVISLVLLFALRQKRGD